MQKLFQMFLVQDCNTFYNCNMLKVKCRKYHLHFNDLERACKRAFSYVLMLHFHLCGSHDCAFIAVLFSSYSLEPSINKKLSGDSVSCLDLVISPWSFFSAIDLSRVQQAEQTIVPDHDQ